MDIWLLKLTAILCFISIIMGAKGASSRAQEKHNCSFDEFNATKTEIPILIWIRGILGLPAYVFLIEWLLPFSFFPWAYLNFPEFINWLGFLLLLISNFLLLWSFRSIKTNYHGTIGLHKQHELITTGAYKYVRHPIEISFLLVHFSIFILTSNWMLGILLISTGLAVLILRTPVEEKFLIDRFGDAYIQYFRKTGKYFPRLFRRKPI